RRPSLSLIFEILLLFSDFEIFAAVCCSALICLLSDCFAFADVSVCCAIFQFAICVPRRAHSTYKRFPIMQEQPQRLMLYQEFKDLRKRLRPMCALEKRAQNFFGFLTESAPHVTR